ncbi:unnamed protein product [Effrenium voratum]|uniref:AAA+ ATPase domain-containing protein n=1 Tax=Effrenium voratum TaxID=2562239 RepID=A0AA36J270_9DINO|nr:unnamed protein product [Effrenium voratum]
MPVFSKMSRSRTTGVMLAGGVATLLAPAFVAPGVPRAEVSTVTQTSQMAQAAPVRSEPSLTAVAGVAMAGAAMAAGAAGARGTRRAKGRTVVAAQPMGPTEGQPMEGPQLSKLTALAQELLQKPSPQQLQRLVLELRSFAAAELQRAHAAPARRSAFAEVAEGAEQALRSGVEGQLRWAASAAAAMLLSNVVTLQPAQAADVVNYSEFLESVNRGDVEMFRVQEDMLSAQYTTKDGSRREVNLIPNAQIEDQLFNQLADKKVDVVVGTNQQASPLDFLRRFAGPLAWLVAGLLLLFGGPLGGAAGPGGGPGGNPFELGKAKARIAKDGETGTKFADVAGCDGAKQELVEVVDFLKNTSRYSELGAKIPKGALLVGPPGTGKTLLAKAVAGEAGVPFFSIAASEFVEVFAGVGASRVRDLFEQAKKSAPCIIFIDEIDAVGRQRSAGFGQGNDEREQTVNQLLTEMDGFEANKGVVVIAATNRADILDQALVRPGRFDRQIQVDPPDVQGRTEILKVHAKSKNLAPGVDLTSIARMTPGMSGADLANLLNEGAIVAARQNKTEIDQDDIANALERIAIGLEKKDAVMSEKKKRLVAYHEAGHAILGALMNDYDVVAKISIVPRGPAGGVTIFTPSEERLDSGLYTKEFLENRMCVALGGRLAEEIINGKDNVTTGASNDFQQCTQVAKQMVMSLGMSPAIGQRLLGGQQGGGPFMGRDFMGQSAPPMSQALRQQLVAELPAGTTGLINKLLEKQIQIEVHTPEKPNPLLGALGDAALPLLLIGGLLYFRSRGPGTGGIPGMNQKAQIMMTPETGVKFEDVAGIEEAKQELTEIVDFLRAPERFVKVGAKIPRGVLLRGPPGTGKTLMAKALAGEAKVPFIQASASEFIELFVGVGASRVRDIFKQAKENSPCIVFIDELDAIGRQRGAGMGGGNDEREQTLNQILTEMDGFEGNSGVIVVAATNRADILDNALLRPGRFDRRVTVGLPDVKGREQILNVHVKNKKLAEEVTLLDIAKRTAGFSGADLENLMNESAILAARRNKTGITMLEINDATDRVIAGLEGRAMPDSASKKLVAYHEAGHAVVGTMLPYHDPVNKVTLIPRGQAKGLTWFTPGEDQSLISAAMLKARISGALGGRAAEQLVFGTDQVTTGAGGDLQQVERMARAMVTQFGMSQVGSIAIDEGGMMGPSYSEALSSEIDGAVKSISDECYLRALTLLAEHRAALDKIAEELCEVETMSGERLKQILEEHTAVPEKLTAV